MLDRKSPLGYQLIHAPTSGLPASHLWRRYADAPWAVLLNRSRGHELPPEPMDLVRLAGISVLLPCMPFFFAAAWSCRSSHDRHFRVDKPAPAYAGTRQIGKQPMTMTVNRYKRADDRWSAQGRPGAINGTPHNSNVVVSAFVASGLGESRIELTIDHESFYELARAMVISNPAAAQQAFARAMKDDQ